MLQARLVSLGRILNRNSLTKISYRLSEKGLERVETRILEFEVKKSKLELREVQVSEIASLLYSQLLTKTKSLWVFNARNPKDSNHPKPKQ